MFWRFLPFTFALVAAGTCAAETTDYTAGKTPAQLFASDCSTCHKSPQGLAKGRDTKSLAGFLREHYTTKPESAGALAAFVAAAGAAPEGKPKPGARDAKPDPAAASAKPRRGEQAGEADQKPKPRATTAGAEPKPGDEPKPAQRRPAAAGEGGRPVASRPARPEGAEPGAKPPAGAEPKPAARTRPTAPANAAPANAAKREPEKPAQPAGPDDKLKASPPSGEEPKEAKTDDPEAARAAARKLEGYASSGGSAAAIAPPRPAPSAEFPQAKPETDKAAEQPKTAEQPKAAEPPKAAEQAPAAAPQRPRRAAAPVEGGDPAPESR